MAYDAKYDNMSVVELITACTERHIDYHKGREILDAPALRKKLGKKSDKE